MVGLPVFGFFNVWTMVWLPVFGFFNVWTMVWLPVFGFFNVWTMVGLPVFGFLTCGQVVMHAIVHEASLNTVRKSAEEADSGRKIPYCTRDLNPRRRCTLGFPVGSSAN